MCQANHFKEILMIINTDIRRRARERERQKDAHGIVYALAERRNCTCEENHLKGRVWNIYNRFGFKFF